WLQSRQTPHRGGIAPIISSRDGHKSRAAVLDIDDNHGSARPHLSAVRKLDGLTESKLFFPIISFFVPDQGPYGIPVYLVDVENLFGVAVIGILRCNLQNIGIDHFPLLVGGQIVSRLAIERNMFFREISEHFLFA